MNNRITSSYRGDSGLALADRDVVEIPLLLPSWQVAALADAAQDRGQTAGEMLRHVLQDFIMSLEERQTYATH
jgi:hypothetical protein